MSSIKPWAKLVTLNKLQAQTVELTGKQVSIGRLDGNSIKLEDFRVSSKHCIIEYDKGVCYLTDLSTNGTLVNGSKVGKGSKIVIENGSEIHILTEGPKVLASEVISYVFIVLEQPKARQPPKPKPDPPVYKQSKLDHYLIVLKKPKAHQRPKPDPPVQKQIKLDHYFDEFTCNICSDIMYQPISLIPCLHTFCGGCFSTWVKKEPTCPNCRKPVDSARKNAQFQNLLEIYLKDNPDNRRPQKELDRLNRENDIKEEKVFKKEAPKVPQQIQQRPPLFGKEAPKVPQQIQQPPSLYGNPFIQNNFGIGFQQPKLQNPIINGMEVLHQATYNQRPFKWQNYDENSEDESDDSGCGGQNQQYEDWDHEDDGDDYGFGEQYSS